MLFIEHSRSARCAALVVTVYSVLSQFAHAGDLISNRALNTSVAKVLDAAGIIQDFPVESNAMFPIVESMAIQADKPVGPQIASNVNGVIIRFSSFEVKRSSRENQPPPQWLIEEVRRLAGVPLTFKRAMSMDSYVFSFGSPMDWSAAQLIIDCIKQSSNVENVDPDVQSNSLFVPNDTYSDVQWNLQSPTFYAGAANLGPAWDITQGSSNTIVAIVDTGVRPHADFSSRLLPGYDFVSDAFRANDGDGRDADSRDPGDWRSASDCVGKSASDSSWHGTHVTGIVAATGNNASGIAGVNWKTSILPVRVLGKCGGTSSDIVDGMSWAAGLNVPGVPTNLNPANIINMSLGGIYPNGCGKSPYQEAINRIKAKGVLIVVAAGNDNADAATFVPASCDGVMTVGAVGPTGNRASYSNYSMQYRVDISAPGGDSGTYGTAFAVLSTVNSGKTVPEFSDFGYKQGTSMAAPHVAGIAALALALDSQIAPELLQLSLMFTSRPFPASTQCASMSPLCGMGIVDAYMTLQAVYALKPYSLIYEYKNINTSHYFRTNNAGESAYVLTGGAGAGWVDTKDYFLAWRDSSQGAVPVCRFYGAGPNSHFFTADAGECALVKKNPDWAYEGIAYYAKPTIQGACPAGTVPIYRAYNNRWMFNDGNHRFSTDRSAMDELVAKSWVFEGIAMCAAGG